ncbi:retinol dehydrogenase 14-like isoform X2 [Corticium candelabrum]|uniref:retinol dehydrogenase 14-like isoform X2 n=1 Tax=Corticium candelabrum TaxID=121492 RepID=UPI002E254641|nr:retinol dehydrogenase 14-like isoform X2 [Corticium candelabrum]
MLAIIHLQDLRYIGGRMCRSLVMLNGKTVIITGANTGIGKATAIDLAGRGARVIMACKDTQRGQKACGEVKELSGSENVVFGRLDLADLGSVRDFVRKVLEEERQVDVLINNAGVMACPFTKTSDGFEMQLGVNHLGHFLLTNLLLDRLKASAPSRVINVSSKLHDRGQINFEDLQSEKSYGGVRAYAQSKLANVLFTRQLAERLDGTGVTVCSLTPGLVRTELGRHMFRSKLVYRILWVVLYPLYWLVTKSPSQGAQTLIYCAVAEELEGVSGRYYADCAETKLREHAMDDGVAKKLWEISEQLTGLCG